MVERHLAKIASMLHAYSTCIEDLRLSREKKKQEEVAELSKTERIYMKKLRAIRKQLMDYRGTLKPILNEIGIDIRVESWTHAAQILQPRHSCKNYIIFAIAPLELKAPQRWQYCGFMAILGGFQYDEITFYEYADEIDRKNREDTAAKHNEFEKHAWRLVNIPIDHFDLEAVKPFIHTYLSKELNYIALQYPSPSLLTFDKSKLWNSTPQQTAEDLPQQPEESTPQETTQSIPQQKTQSSFYQVYNPILEGIKYVKRLFGRAKKK